MKKTTSRFSSLLIALIASLGSLLLTTSCSDDGLLSSIPADADYCATVNFTRLTDGLDIQIDESSITGPADMKIEFQSIPADVRSALCNLNGAIDASCVMVFGNFSVNASETPLFILARVTDSDKLESMLAESTDLDRQTIDGFRVYADNMTFLIADDNRLWLLPRQASAESAVKSIKNVLDRAKKKHIGKLDHVASRLDNDKVVSAVINLDPMIDFVSSNAYYFLDTQQAMAASAILPMLKGNWLDMTFDLDDNQFTLTTSAFNPETGDTAQLLGDFTSGDIDDDLLEYLPANTSMAYAATINSQTARQLTTGLAAFTGGNRLFAPLLNSLSKIDGTIAVGLGAKDSDADISAKNADVFLAVQFADASAANDFKSQAISAFSALTGEQPTEAGEMTNVKTSDLNLNLTTRSNTFFLTTLPALQSESNIFAKDMDDYPAAFEFFVPNMGEMTAGRCHMQLKTLLTVKEGVSTLTISFDKLQGSLLSELVKAVQGINLKNQRRYQLPDAEEIDPQFTYPSESESDSPSFDELLEN